MSVARRISKARRGFGRTCESGIREKGRRTVRRRGREIRAGTEAIRGRQRRREKRIGAALRPNPMTKMGQKSSTIKFTADPHHPQFRGPDRTQKSSPRMPRRWISLSPTTRVWTTNPALCHVCRPRHRPTLMPAVPFIVPTSTFTKPRAKSRRKTCYGLRSGAFSSRNPRPACPISRRTLGCRWTK